MGWYRLDGLLLRFLLRIRGTGVPLNDYPSICTLSLLVVMDSFLSGPGVDHDRDSQGDLTAGAGIALDIGSDVSTLNKLVP